MYKTIVNIDGMMCGHCEAHVNEALRNKLGVSKVNSSHEAGQTTIIAEDAIAEDAIREALDGSGYEVLSVASEPYEKKGLFGGKFGGGAR